MVVAIVASQRVPVVQHFKFETAFRRGLTCKPQNSELHLDVSSEIAIEFAEHQIISRVPILTGQHRLSVRYFPPTLIATVIKSAADVPLLFLLATGVPLLLPLLRLCSMPLRIVAWLLLYCKMLTRNHLSRHEQVPPSVRLPLSLGEVHLSLT